MLHIPIVHAHDVSKHIPQEKFFHRVKNVTKQLVHTSAVRSSRYEARGKFGEQLQLLECSLNFPRASYLDECTLTYEPIVNERIKIV